MKVASFRGMPWRCACSGDGARLAVFVRFTGLAANAPFRTAAELEAGQCRAAIEATCTRRMFVDHDRELVAILAR